MPIEKSWTSTPPPDDRVPQHRLPSRKRSRSAAVDEDEAGTDRPSAGDRSPTAPEHNLSLELLGELVQNGGTLSHHFHALYDGLHRPGCFARRRIEVEVEVGSVLATITAPTGNDAPSAGGGATPAAPESTSLLLRAFRPDVGARRRPPIIVVRTAGAPRVRPAWPRATPRRYPDRTAPSRIGCRPTYCTSSRRSPVRPSCSPDREWYFSART